MAVTSELLPPENGEEQDQRPHDEADDRQRVLPVGLDVDAAEHQPQHGTEAGDEQEELESLVEVFRLLHRQRSLIELDLPDDQRHDQRDDERFCSQHQPEAEYVKIEHFPHPSAELVDGVQVGRSSLRRSTAVPRLRHQPLDPSVFHLALLAKHRGSGRVSHTREESQRGEYCRSHIFLSVLGSSPHKHRCLCIKLNIYYSINSIKIQ